MPAFEDAHGLSSPTPMEFAGMLLAHCVPGRLSGLDVGGGTGAAGPGDRPVDACRTVHTLERGPEADRTLLQRRPSALLRSRIPYSGSQAPDDLQSAAPSDRVLLEVGARLSAVLMCLARPFSLAAGS